MIGLLAIATLLGAAAAEDSAAPEIQRVLENLENLRQRIVLAHGTSLEPDQDFFLSDWTVDDEVIQWWNHTTGTRWLDSGTNRVAVRLQDGRVMKIALDEDGKKANLNELATWNEAQGDTEVLDFLVPLYGGNETFLVMDYAEPLGFIDENDPVYRQRQQAWGSLLLQGRSRAMDVPYFNWGKHEGKLRLLDYEKWE